MVVLTLLLAAMLLVFAVCGAELVRNTCRRQLMAPMIVPRPLQGTADLD